MSKRIVDEMPTTSVRETSGIFDGAYESDKVAGSVSSLALMQICKRRTDLFAEMNRLSGFEDALPCSSDISVVIGCVPIVPEHFQLSSNRSFRFGISFFVMINQFAMFVALGGLNSLRCMLKSTVKCSIVSTTSRRAFPRFCDRRGVRLVQLFSKLEIVIPGEHNSRQDYDLDSILISKSPSVRAWILSPHLESNVVN